MTAPLDDITTVLTESYRRHVDQAGPLQQETNNSIFTKIRFSWRENDKLFLDLVKNAAQKMFEEQFDSVLTLLDEFYAKAKDKDGKESWDRLTNSDIDAVLFSLEKIKFTLVPRVTELMHEAVFAKHISEDAYNETWTSIIDGTQGDRAAKSSRASREDRYAAYYRFVLWSTADSFLKQINSFQRVAERERDWRSRGYR